MATQLARYERVLYPLVRQNAAQDIRSLSDGLDFKEFMVSEIRDKAVLSRISKLLCDCIRTLRLPDRTSGKIGDFAELRMEYTLAEFKKHYGSDFGDIVIEQKALPFRVLFDLSLDIPDATEGGNVPNMLWGKVSVSRQGDYFWMPFGMSMFDAKKKLVEKLEQTFGFIGVDAKAAKCATVCRIVGTERMQDAVFSGNSCFFAMGNSSILSMPLEKAHGIHSSKELSVIVIEPLSSTEDERKHHISMGYMENVLYVGFERFKGPRGLLAYDLQARRWDVIASSRSGNFRSLFSEIPCNLTAGPDGKRLYLTERSLGVLKWYDPSSRKFGKVWRNGDALWRIVPLGNEWWIYTHGEIIGFNPVAETTRRLAVFGPGPTYFWMGGGKVPKGPPEFRLRFACANAAVFRNTVWVEDQGRLLCYPLTSKEPDPIVFEPEIFGKDFEIRNILPTPYGVIILGKNKIILIDDIPVAAKEKLKE